METDFTTRALLRLADLFRGKRIDRAARDACREVAREPVCRSLRHAEALLTALEAEPGPHVELGETLWDERVPLAVPLPYLVKAHAVITGGTGSGKTMAALALIQSLLSTGAQRFSFGVLDAKGELFERTLYLVVRRLERLPDREAEALARRLVIIDLASPDPVTSYNIACPWAGSDPDFFAASRVETLAELLPAGDGFSLRGASIVKHALKLLAARRLPFSYLDRVLSSEPLRARLLAGSKDDELRHYFRQHFPSEGRATIAAVRARIAAALLSSESLKLALAGDGAPDFRRLQDEGRIVLVNCAGPNIARPTARVLQALVLSDIRQAVFARKTRRPFLWVCDEAQNFFRTRQLRENMTDLLTMSRSFGAFFLYLTQNLSTAVQDGEMLETLHTNLRWSLTLRGTSKDGAFLRAALPVTGSREKPRLNRYATRACYTPAEERNLLVEELAYLPDRTGWLWLKSRSPEAIKIRTRTMAIPDDAAFEERVARIRAEAAIGDRTPREAHLASMARRDEAWREEEGNPAEALRKSFRGDRHTVPVAERQDGV
jgi:Helicase HerA, central domain